MMITLLNWGGVFLLILCIYILRYILFIIGVGYSPYNRMGAGYGGYSRFGAGTGGYGSYSGGYGSGYGGGMYGMNRPGMQVGPNGLPLTNSDEIPLTAQIEQSTAAAFGVMDQVVQAFGGFAQMLESTFFATHSSFMAMVGVAEQLVSSVNQNVDLKILSH